MNTNRGMHTDTFVPYLWCRTCKWPSTVVMIGNDEVPQTGQTYVVVNAFKNCRQGGGMNVGKVL